MFNNKTRLRLITRDYNGNKKIIDSICNYSKCSKYLDFNISNYKSQKSSKYYENIFKHVYEILHEHIYIQYIKGSIHNQSRLSIKIIVHQKF